jgi:hypothetical protein
VLETAQVVSDDATADVSGKIPFLQTKKNKIQILKILLRIFTVFCIFQLLLETWNVARRARKKEAKVISFYASGCAAA